METKFKDVAHLYLGCDVVRPDNRTTMKYIGVHGNILIFQEKDNPDQTFGDVNKCKPILHHLASMTDKQESEASQMYFDFMETQNPGTRDINMMSEMTRWFLSHHFDLFGLIESGQAIDATIKP